MNAMNISRLITIAMTLVVVIFLSSCESTSKVDKSRSLDSHITLALKYIEIKNRESARHHLRRAFDINKKSVDAHFAMAMLYQLEGEPVLAENFFRKTLKLKKNYTQANNNFGVFLFSRERYDEAYKYFSIATTDLEYEKRAQALLNLGRSAIKLGKLDRAKAAFSHADLLDSKIPLVKYELANLYFKQQDFSAAKQYLDEFERISNPAPQALLLGIKIEKVFKNQDKEASYAMALKNMYPYSEEYLNYTKMNN